MQFEKKIKFCLHVYIAIHIRHYCSEDSVIVDGKDVFADSQQLRYI